MMGEPNQSEQVGYLRGRLDGHEGRIGALEMGLTRIDRALEGNKEILSTHTMTLTEQNKTLAKITKMLTSWVAVWGAFGAVGGIALSILIAMIEGHWWLFK